MNDDTLAAGGGWNLIPTQGWGVAEFLRRALERLPAREAFVEAVPEPDLLLAEAPAEQNLLVGAARGKVDEPGVQILDKRPNLLDPGDAPRDPRDLLVQLLLDLLQLVRLDVAAVPRDPRGERRLSLLQLDERPPVADQFLGERPHFPERLVRLLDREVPRLHARMIRPL